MCGCESCVLTNKVLKQLNEVNNTVLIHITGQSVGEETKEDYNQLRTCSSDQGHAAKMVELHLTSRRSQTCLPSY